MSDLISKSALQEAIEVLSYHADKYVIDEEKHGFCTGIAVAIRQVELMPTIEAEPRKHGRWIRCGENLYECSKCEAWVTTNKYIPIGLHKFCRGCGARMDDVEE